LWVQHLTAMDEMRRGIGLRAYGQIDPLVAFKKEALLMWEELGITIRSSILKSIVSQSYLTADDQKIIPMNSNDLSKISNENSNSNLENSVSFQSINKVSRNTTCPCGSGLKYKKCHGLN
jgi:preprotein translocase subunit SecA